MFLMSKQKKIEVRLGQYHQSISDCLEAFKDAISTYCQTQNMGRLREAFYKVHKAESLADDIRREIEVAMYTKALFPESRGDILGLLETMDRVPNQAEAVVRMIVNQNIVIPEAMHPQILQLVDVCCRCVSAMVDSAGKLLSDFTSATIMVGKIDELESEADQIESALTQQLFATHDNDLEKILLRDLIHNIAMITDRAENVGDRIRIVVAKRSI